MKAKFNTLLVLLVTLLVTNGAHAAPQWHRGLKVVYVQLATFGYATVKFDSDIGAEQLCRSANAVRFPTTTSTRIAIYDTLLKAHLEQKDVDVHLNGCHNGIYPLLHTIRVNN